MDGIGWDGMGEGKRRGIGYGIWNRGLDARL